MDATAEFSLGDKVYRLSAPSAIQLTTMRNVVRSFYAGQSVRQDLKDKLGVGEIEHIVDVGACIGTMSLCLHHIWPQAHILALEPHPVSFAHLERNCQDFQNIRPVGIAASDKRETIRLAIPDPAQRPDFSERQEVFFNVGMASRYGTSDRYAATVEAAPLDELVRGRVDFIKIDVEGAEKTVIDGAIGIIERDRPLLEIELRRTNLAMAGTTVEELVDLLKGLGYRAVGTLYGDVLFQYKT